MLGVRRGKKTAFYLEATLDLALSTIGKRPKVSFLFPDRFRNNINFLVARLT